MAGFSVKYEIDVEAETPEEAALQVEQILKNMNFRPCFSVTPSVETIEIDLESGDTQI